MTGVVRRGGRARPLSPGPAATPDYLAYHDTEWGVPVHGESAIYERLTLEAFQSGLSWMTILRKRVAFRAAFAGFDPEQVARFGDDDRARLMADTGIVRNRLKVDAAITNARAVLGAARRRWSRRALLVARARAPRPTSRHGRRAGRPRRSRWPSRRP